MSAAARAALASARSRPALALYLLAIGLLPWMSPLPGAERLVIPADLLAGAAIGAWLLELRGRRCELPQRGVQLALVAFVATTVAAAAFAANTALAARYSVGTLYLVALMLLTCAFAREQRERAAIAVTLTVTALAVALLAIGGLLLFYLGAETGLIGAYGEQLQPSDSYARVQATFTSPPLLASWCIFASAVIAWPDSPVPRRWRLVAQTLLALTVIATLSRALLGFAAAAAIRWSGRRRMAPAAAAVMVAVAAVAMLTIARIEIDPSRPQTLKIKVPDDRNRLGSIERLLETLAQNPLTGLGPGSLPGENAGEPFKAHLTPLNVAATSGLPALASLIALLLILWRSRGRPTDVVVWSGLAGLGIDALAQDVEHFRHTWVLLGLAAAHPQPRVLTSSRAARCRSAMPHTPPP